MASRSIICRIPRLRQITDLRDTAGEITILCDNRVQNFFYYSVITFVYIFRTFSNNSGGSRICHFSHKSAWLQLRRIFAAKTHLVSISHNQIVCRQLFPSHEVVFRPIIRRTTEKNASNDNSYIYFPLLLGKYSSLFCSPSSNNC